MTDCPSSGPCTEGPDAGDRTSPTAQARALALRRMGATALDRLAAHAGSADVVDSLLDLRAVAITRLPPDDPELVAAVSTVRYTTAAHLVVRPAPGGGSFMVSAAALLRDLAGREESLPLDPRLRRDPPDPVLTAYAARRSPQAGRGRDHGGDTGRLSFGPDPVAVLSTAGEPVTVATALSSHLARWDEDRYRDVRVLVVDDARGHVSEQLDGVLTVLSRRYPWARLVRFAEEAPGGRPGPKSALRDQVRRLVHDDLAGDVDRIFAGNATGSANATFALLPGLPLLWLEQDSAPNALHVRHPAGDVPLPAGRLEDAIDVVGESAVDGDRHTASPVDVRHVVDRLLYGPPEYPAFERAEPTYEDLGMERVGRFTGWAGRAAACHFHITGHPDYRARFSHNALTLSDVAPPTAARLLEGGLDRRRVLVRPPAPAVLDSPVTTFGTAVGLNHSLPLTVPCMAATSIRLFDFSVAALLSAAGRYPVAWAATALTHARSAATTSGRGRLAAYVANEDLLWPTLHAITAMLERVSRQSGEDSPAWLDRAGRFVEREACSWEPTARESRRIWLEGRADAFLDDVPATVGRYLRDGSAEADWLILHRRLRERIRRELWLYGRQLRIWSVVVTRT